MFNVNRLDLTEGQWHWPTFKGKAANTQHVTAWLAHYTTADNGNLHARRRALVLWALAQLWHIMKASGMWFTDDRARAFAEAGRTLFDNWRCLAHEAQLQKRPRWQVRPKHHALEHTIISASITKRNPRTHWCFKDESQIGLIKKLAQKSHPSTVSLRVLTSAYIKWALRLERPPP
eukprot:12497454-Alexandrium_andersonii.AAC.1